MIKTISKTAVFVLFAAFLALSATAQDKTMYSYTDEDGTVVYTDRKPVGQEFEEQALPEGQPRQYSDPAEEPQAAELTAAQQRREDIAKQRHTAQEQQAELQAKCGQWREEVKRLEPSRRVYYKNEQGETVRMDDVERANRVTELKDSIAEFCP